MPICTIYTFYYLYVHARAADVSDDSVSCAGSPSGGPLRCFSTPPLLESNLMHPPCDRCEWGAPWKDGVRALVCLLAWVLCVAFILVSPLLLVTTALADYLSLLVRLMLLFSGTLTRCLDSEVLIGLFHPRHAPQLSLPPWLRLTSERGSSCAPLLHEGLRLPYETRATWYSGGGGEAEAGCCVLHFRAHTTGDS